MQSLRIEEPEWFNVLGGPPPGEIVLRDIVLSLVLPAVGLLISPWLSGQLRFLCVFLPLLTAVPMFFLLQHFWHRSQQIRIIGSVLEHRDGERVQQVGLNRAVLSTASAPPAKLVLMLDDGRSCISIARKASLRELSDLPPSVGPYLELSEEDFEAIARAAHRSYPQA
ncbi:MAG TPA: hypothetical protein PLA87_06355 [Pseudomonadota bacterium]|jgi:hypothetical protein|nr:hypothetical protein [Pseudomonadota bacterium]